MDPISIRIPPELKHFAVSPSKYYESHPDCERIVVGAFIFRHLPGTKPAMLLLQRAATERAFPNDWEMPGGSAELSDPTIFHSVARETFEETGLHLTRVVRQVGEGIRFASKPECLKVCFEIEVSELHRSAMRKSCIRTDSGSGSQTTLTEGGSLADQEEEILVTLDPAEHQKYAWLTEAEVKDVVEKWSFPGEDTLPAILQAFDTHRAAP